MKNHKINNKNQANVEVKQSNVIYISKNVETLYE
jgi:hypothetical protein